MPRSASCSRHRSDRWSPRKGSEPRGTPSSPVTVRSPRWARRSLPPVTSVDAPLNASELPLGAPAAYWLDLRDYDPAAPAATLGKPMLILQRRPRLPGDGRRRLVLWQARLSDHPGVTIRVYPELNHLFALGRGPSSPEEYEPVQHVDTTVITDVAGWLTSLRGT